MAIVLNTTPGTYQSVQGDIVFIAYEATKAIDPVTYPNYKYVCDVYVDSTLVARLKVFPDPTNNRGLFNIGQVLRNYIDSLELSIASGILATEFTESEFYLTAQCKFGEEYGGTLYTNLTVDSSRVYFNNYITRSEGYQNNLSTYVNKALSYRPYETPIYRQAKHHFIPYLAGSTGSFTAEVKTYGFDNALIDTETKSVSATTADALEQFNVSPTAINQEWAATIGDNVKYYTVALGGTSIYKFDLFCEPMHEVYTIHFLNRFGGFESYDFSKLSRKTYDIERKDYGRLSYRMDASGNLAYYNSSNVYYDTRTTYASQFREKLKLTTDFLTDDQNTWLADLIVSPLVYVQDGDYLIPVVITANNYDFRKYINDKLTPLTIDIEFGRQLNAQYR